MPFPDLQTLLQASNSSRQFLLSLPVDVQLQLHEQNEWIHTQADLRRYAAYYHIIAKKGGAPVGTSPFSYILIFISGLPASAVVSCSLHKLP